jgi:hypothetical protein
MHPPYIFLLCRTYEFLGTKSAVSICYNTCKVSVLAIIRCLASLIGTHVWSQRVVAWRWSWVSAEILGLRAAPTMHHEVQVWFVDITVSKAHCEPSR